MNEYVAFSGERLVAAGDLLSIALESRKRLKKPGEPMVLIFEDATGRQIDIDIRGSAADLKKRFANFGKDTTGSGGPTSPAKRGRPKLGVVGREVTLVPTHWAWLDNQRGGASASLRRLVNNARRENEQMDRMHQSQDRANRFMSAIGGNLAGFEEATRALYAGDRPRFLAETEDWPSDIKATALKFAEDAFQAT